MDHEMLRSTILTLAEEHCDLMRRDDAVSGAIECLLLLLPQEMLGSVSAEIEKRVEEYDRERESAGGVGSHGTRPDGAAARPGVQEHVPVDSGRPVSTAVSEGRPRRPPGRSPKPAPVVGTDDYKYAFEQVAPMFAAGKSPREVADAKGWTLAYAYQLRRQWTEAEAAAGRPEPPLPRSRHSEAIERHGIEPGPAAQQWTDKERKAATKSALDRNAARNVNHRDGTVEHRAKRLFASGADIESVADELEEAGLTPSRLRTIFSEWKAEKELAERAAKEKGVGLPKLSAGKPKVFEVECGSAVKRQEIIRELGRRGFKMVAPMSDLLPGQYSLPRASADKAPIIFVDGDSYAAPGTTTV